MRMKIVDIVRMTMTLYDWVAFLNSSFYVDFLDLISIFCGGLISGMLLLKVCKNV
jgi:hypothetical protein